MLRTQSWPKDSEGVKELKRLPYRQAGEAGGPGLPGGHRRRKFGLFAGRRRPFIWEDCQDGEEEVADGLVEAGAVTRSGGGGARSRAEEGDSGRR
jgi:hypothetical protein